MPLGSDGEAEATTRTRRMIGGAYPDISDELPVFCSECAEREFG